MLTARQRAQWRTARDTLDGHLISTLDRIMESAHGAPGKEVKDLILNTIPEIVKAHETVTAELTAELYALARTNAGLDDLFTPQPIGDPNEEQIAGSLRWALRPISGSTYTAIDYGRAVERVRVATTRLMRQTEGKTVAGNILVDPAKPMYRRVPEANACAFCMMLATRGHVYTKETVGTRGSPHARFHERCKCSSEPQYKGEDLPPLVKAAEKAWHDFAKSADGKEKFFAFVEDGGLGDRPRPGRDKNGNYRKTIDGEDVPFNRKDIHFSFAEVWKHITKQKNRAGGHMYENIDDWRKRLAEGKTMPKVKTMFPAGTTREQVKKYVQDTLRNPTRITKHDSWDQYMLRREFDGVTVEIVVAMRKNDPKPYSVVSAYPVAGEGAQTLSPVGVLSALPETVPR